MSLLVGGCSDRPLDDLGGSAGSSGIVDDGPHDDDDPTPGEGQTSGASSSAADESSSGDESEPDPCEPYLDAHQDPEQTCGLVQVEFGWEAVELDLAARCQLDAAAPCIAAQARPLYLEAHASADEGIDEEDAIALSSDRGTTVEAYLIDRGVPAERMQVIAKGNLEASRPDSAVDRRVALSW